MKRFPRFPASAALAVGLATLLLTATASAQPEGGPPPGPPRQDGPRPPQGPPHHPPFDPLRRALDADGDHVLSSDEIANAASALKTLDKNGDGKLDHEELRPPMPPGMEHRRGDRGRGPGPEGDRRGPPPEGDRPEGRGAFRGPDGPRPPMPSPEQMVDRMMEFDADKDGKLDRTELTAAAGRMAEKMAERRKEFMERIGQRSRGPERRDP
jgi:hypothetical protein